MRPVFALRRHTQADLYPQPVSAAPPQTVNAMPAVARTPRAAARPNASAGDAVYTVTILAPYTPTPMPVVPDPPDPIAQILGTRQGPSPC